MRVYAIQAEFCCVSFSVKEVLFKYNMFQTEAANLKRREKLCEQDVLVSSWIKISIRQYMKKNGAFSSQNE